MKIKEVNFSSGLCDKYDEFYNYEDFNPGCIASSPVFFKLLKYDRKDTKLNATLMAFEISSAISYMYELINVAYQDKEILKKGGIIFDKYRIDSQREQIIHIMKRIIDNIIMTVCNFYSKWFEIDSIGKLLQENYKCKSKNIRDLRTNIVNDLHYEKFKKLFSVINDLHNAYKHSALISESHSRMSVEAVSFIAYHFKTNNKEEVFFYNHNLFHIKVGFNDFMKEFFGVKVCNREHNIYLRDIN